MTFPLPTPPAKRGRPLRERLLWLAASGLLPLMLVLAWGAGYLVQQQREEGLRSVLALSRALATAVEGELNSTVALLETLAVGNDLEHDNLRTFYDVASRTARQRGWTAVVLTDAEGQVLLRTSLPYGSANKAVEPASIRRAVEIRAPVVGNVVEGRTLPYARFAVRVPVLRNDNVVFVLSATLSTDSILRVVTRQDVPAASVISVFDASGRRVASSRQVQSPFPSPSLKSLLDQGGPQGSGETLTREGVTNYTGYTRLSGSGWVVAAGRSVVEAGKGLDALLTALAAGLVASLALSALLAWLASRRVLAPIESLKTAAGALGRGEAVSLEPLGVAELDDLGSALKAAAAERDAATEERTALTTQISHALQIAKDAGRSKDQFLAMLGHELRNPLAPISNAVQLMALKGDPGTAQERRVIERQLQHVTRLVDDLLDVSRITGGRLHIRHEPVRLAGVLAQVVDGMGPSLQQRSLSLELVAGSEQAWVNGDEVRLAQVFNNLLVNAIKFTPADGEIRVLCRLAGDGDVLAEVRDTGIGIATGDLERVFELFYQAPQGSDRSQGGLGLGLAIVRSLAAIHGGTALASSAGPGTGSTFSVRLPLCEAPAAAPTSSPAVNNMHGHGNILVVDDNQDAADTCAAFLEMSGYTTRVAYTPEAALAALGEFVPAVAILDIGLPGMSGYELAQRLKAPPLHYGGKLVALTGYGQPADIAASKAAGFDAHLTKPVAPTALAELIEGMLRTSGDIRS